MGTDLIVNVIWPSYHAATSRHGSWDMGLLEDLFDGQLWSPVRGHLYLHRNTFEETPEDVSGAVVVLPGQHHAGDIERLNGDLKRFSWVLMILVGDEESLFSIEAVLKLQKLVFAGSPLSEVLSNIAQLVESQAEGMSCTM